MSELDTTAGAMFDSQPLSDGADLQGLLSAKLRERNIDPSRIDWQTPVMDPGGWRFGSPVEAAEHYTEHALRALAVHADGEFDFDRLPATHDVVQQWVASQLADPGADPLLLLRGVVGCGKTSQLFCLLRALVLHHAQAGRRYPWYFITHRNLAAAVQRGSGRDPEKLISDLMRAEGVVVLDDLGDYNTQDFGDGASATSRIINHRAHHRLPLALSTNLPFVRTEAGVAALADTLDARAISRLQSGWVFTMKAVDHRACQGRRFSE